jgi:hypothetical protein
MLTKLKRGHLSPKKSIAINAIPGRARRGNVLLTKTALEEGLKGKDGENDFLSKLDVIRKRHGV